jgi:hypothetical protein
MMWDKAFLTRILMCISAFGVSLYAYVNKQNEVTRRRLAIPVVAKEIKDLKEINTHLQYEIDLFESPEHLMQLASHSEYSHLRHPLVREILTMPEALALEVSSEEKEERSSRSSRKLPIAAISD